jgi:hypothetical protein
MFVCFLYKEKLYWGYVEPIWTKREFTVELHYGRSVPNIVNIHSVVSE